MTCSLEWPHSLTGFFNSLSFVTLDFSKKQNQKDICGVGMCVCVCVSQREGGRGVSKAWFTHTMRVKRSKSPVWFCLLELPSPCCLHTECFLLFSEPHWLLWRPLIDWTTSTLLISILLQSTDGRRYPPLQITSLTTLDYCVIKYLGSLARLSWHPRLLL